MKQLSSILMIITLMGSGCLAVNSQEKPGNAALRKVSESLYSKLIKKGLLTNKTPDTRPVIFVGITGLQEPSKISEKNNIGEIISRPFKEKCTVITNLNEFKGVVSAPYSLNVNFTENTDQKVASKKPIYNAMFRLVNLENGLIEGQELFSFGARTDKRSLKLSAEDIADAASFLAESLIKKDIPNKTTQVIAAGRMVNNTIQILPDNMYPHIFMKLVQSGKFSVTAAFNYNELENDPLILAARKLNNFSKSRLKPPTAILSGRVTQTGPITKKDHVEIDYSFTLSLRDISTGRPLWSGTYFISKRGKK